MEHDGFSTDGDAAAGLTSLFPNGTLAHTLRSKRIFLSFQIFPEQTQPQTYPSKLLSDRCDK